MADEHDTQKPQQDKVTFPFRNLKDTAVLEPGVAMNPSAEPSNVIDSLQPQPDSLHPESASTPDNKELHALLQQVKAELVLLYEQLKKAKSSENQEAIDAVYAKIDEARGRQMELIKSISGHQIEVEIDTNQADRYLEALSLDADHMLSRPEQLPLSKDTLVLSSGHLFEFTQLLLSHPTLQGRLQELVNRDTV